MATTKTLRELIYSHFRKHGKPHAVRFLAHDHGVSTTTINNWINASANGIGYDSGQLLPVIADRIIATSVKIMDNPRSRNPVKKHLADLEKEYEKVRRERLNA